MFQSFLIEEPSGSIKKSLDKYVCINCYIYNNIKEVNSMHSKLKNKLKITQKCSTISVVSFLYSQIHDFICIKKSEPNLLNEIKIMNIYHT